jgi:hypothetical protein
MLRPTTEVLVFYTTTRQVAAVNEAKAGGKEKKVQWSTQSIKPLKEVKTKTSLL